MGAEQITCYYFGIGQTPDEFKFLVDYLFAFSSWSKVYPFLSACLMLVMTHNAIF